jgi:hypothetical protein
MLGARGRSRGLVRRRGFRYRSGMAGRRRKRAPAPERLVDPYQEHWQSLRPFERLERAWKLRKLLPDPQAVHDEKTLPKL